ncbi:MAG TPA: SMC-Scp complex subunit ScpB [Alphaproteobacteria bacterium]
MTDRHDERRLLEAMLFAATEPIEQSMLEARLPEGADVGALLGDLQAEYAERGVNLLRVAGKWSFRTAPDLATKLRIETTVPRKLSRAAVETLAILAYHQPATRTDVEQIRGVMISKGTFDTLMEAGWIHPVGRKNTPGRPVTWGTTETFLNHFGLNSLQDLPGIDELKATGLLDPRPASVVVQGMPGIVPPRTEEDTILPDEDSSDEEPEPLAPEAH